MRGVLLTIVPMMDQGDEKSDKTDNGQSNKKNFDGIHYDSPSWVSIKPIKANKTVEESPATRMSPLEKLAPLNMLPRTIPANINLDRSRKYFPISLFMKRQ